MAIVPIGFVRQISDAIEILDAASADPTADNMTAARKAYALGRKLSEQAHARGTSVTNLQPDLDVLARTKRALEAAADRVRQSLRERGLLDEKLD
jgi:hypothetical protein